MTQATPVKVYELAKELGMDSFGLLDILKKNGIEVKSHMSSLEAEQAEAARNFILKAKAPAAAPAKKTATRKAAVRKAATSTTDTVEPPAAPKETKTVSRKRTTSAAATEAPATKTKVIKRRSGAEEDATAAKGTPLTEAPAAYDTPEESELKQEASHAEPSAVSESTSDIVTGKQIGRAHV